MADLTLAEKTYALMGLEHGPMDAILAEPFPPEAAGENRGLSAGPSGDVFDQRHYALAFGIAYALARLEEPFATSEELADTATEAASAAHSWIDSVGGKPEEAMA
jgi:hypothetical protein